MRFGEYRSISGRTSAEYMPHEAAASSASRSPRRLVKSRSPGPACSTSAVPIAATPMPSQCRAPMRSWPSSEAVMAANAGIVASTSEIVVAVA